jgi:hypothetical protein
MWRIHLRFADLAICRFGECSGCQSSDREPQSYATSAKPNFRALKVDAVAMQTLRQIVRRHDLGIMSVSRSTDDQVVARIERMIESGCLQVCRDANAAPSTEKIERGALNGVLRAVLALQAAGDLKFRGRSFRIIPTGEWRRYRETSDYEIVPHAQAKEALESMSADPRRSEDERSTLKSALGLLSDDGRGPSEGKIVLLRAARARMMKSSENDVITPSAFASALAVAQREDVHWIEIEMVDEDGVGIPEQEYLIVTPDRRQFTGVTDSSGRARLDDIVAGQCSVSFQNLDKDSWRRT